MAKKLKDPVQEGLDFLCNGNDSAIGRIFRVTRQSIGQWRRYSSIPRHFMRVFCVLTGIEIADLLEYDELMNGISYEEFLKAAQAQLKKEDRT